MLWKKPSLQPIISSQFSKVTLKPPPTEPVKPEEFDISGHYKPEEEGHGGFSRMPQFVFSLRFVLYDGILWFRPSRHVIEYTMLILCIFMWCIGILIFHVNQGDIDVIHGRHGIWQPDSFGGTRGHRGEKVPGP